MIRKLLFLIFATAALAVGLFLLCQFVFSDVLSYAAKDSDAQSWWRQLAFLVEAIAWMSAEVSGLFAIVLAALLWRQHAVKVS
jgi:F0F1-type ATP synthase membrane subunit c/vacuolar-type H+-ATPase subunit K